MKIKLLPALLALLACTSVAQARTFFDYSGYTYKWAGDGVAEHTSNIKDAATSPAQMVALRDFLMHNKTIPGTVNVDGVPGQDVNYKNSEGVDNTPVEGFTCLLYSLKPGMGNGATEPKTAAQFSATVDSIRLLTNVTECNNAYIVSFTGKYDRFYFAAKGKARANNYWLDHIIYYDNEWELFSPTGNAIGTDGTPDFYNAFVEQNGIYKISHDCADVPQMKHYFDVDPTGANPPQLNNVALVVPKDRMTKWSSSDFTPPFSWPDSETGTSRDDDGPFTWYHPEKCPRLGIYSAKLSATISEGFAPGTDEGGQYGMANINLKWDSNLLDKESLNWPGQETCDVYVTYPNGTEKLLTTIKGSNSGKYNYNHLVDRKLETQKFTYKVVCYPSGTNPNDPVQAITNKVTVIIPGNAKPIANTQLSYRSRFIKEAGLNSYKNTITFTPKYEECEYNIYRKPVAINQNANFDETPVLIANVDLTGHHGDLSQLYWYYLPYNQIDEQDDNKYDWDEFHDAGSYNGSINYPIDVYDYFTETVRDKNQRAASYVYLIRESHDRGQTWSDYSEIGEVPVYSSNLIANYNLYDDQDVFYDADMSNCKPSKLLSLSLVDLERNKAKYADVSAYDIYVGNEIGFHGVKSVAAGADGQVPGAPGTFYVGRLTVNSPYGLNTYGTNEVKKLNTDIIINSQEGIWSSFDKNNNINIYGAQVNFNGVTDKDIAPYVSGYNVKREVQGENPVFLWQLNNQQFANGWSSDYTAIKSDFPTGNKTTPVAFNDVFTGDKEINGETYYVIRMYSTSAPMEEFDQQSVIYVTDIRIRVLHMPTDINTDFSYRSRFIKEAGLNSYKNTVSLYPKTGNTTYKIYRKPVSLNHSTSFDETPIEVALLHTHSMGDRIQWEIFYSNQIDEQDDNRFDGRQNMDSGELGGHPDEFINIYDYFTEEPISDESNRAAAYVYLISKSVNGVWTEPEEIGVAPVYSGELGEPEYLPSYTYDQITEDMRKIAPAELDGLDPTDHADIVFTNYQNEYLTQDDFKAAIHAIYHKGELAVQKQGNSSPKLSVSLSEDGGTSENVGVYIVDSPWGENTYGTAPVITCKPYAELIIDESDTERNGWAWYDTNHTKKTVKVTAEISPRLSSTNLSTAPYVFYYSLSVCDDPGKGVNENNSLLINNLEDVSGHGWATNYAPIKKTYPIGEYRGMELTVEEIRVVEDDYIVRKYMLRMYYTPTYALSTPSETQKFYIFDTDRYVDLNDLITGVNDVNVDKSVVDVKYYNLMGVCSDKPFDGANIKVERHADGTTTSTKMMK